MSVFICPKFLTFRNLPPLLRRVLDLLQRNLQTDSVESNNNAQQVSLDDSENGYWLLEENSNSDSNFEDTNSNSNSNSRRWTSRWIQIVDTSDSRHSRNPEYSAELPNERIRSRSFSNADDIDQNSNDRYRDQRNQLSPMSANPTRYEQPPLFPFRSLRENQSQRIEQNQTSSNTSPGNTLQFPVSDSDMPENIDDSIALRIINEASREGESRTSDRRQQDQQDASDANPESNDIDPILGSMDPTESSLGVRQGIQLLSRHIDNMQRLCR